MKLYFVRSEKASRWVIAADAYRARRYALESGIGGHKIDRHVFRTEDGKIVEVAEPPGVLSEEAAGRVLKSLGLGLNGKRLPAEESKKCLRCGEVKALSLFPKRSGGGYQSYCRECKIQIDREYRRKKKQEGK